VTRSSRIPGFYKQTVAERRAFLKEWANLTDDEVRAYDFPPGIDPGTVERMIENVIGVMPLPLGVATNFQINGKDYLVPMAIEEPSVVAAASNAAKIARESGGFSAQSTSPIMIGQLQILDVSDPSAARHRILDHKEALLTAANAKDPVLVKFGGGAKDVEVRLLPSHRGPMLAMPEE
jgi:hydroxymethylglutaryl-CoA reductase